MRVDTAHSTCEKINQQGRQIWLNHVGKRYFSPGCLVLTKYFLMLYGHPAW